MSSALYYDPNSSPVKGVVIRFEPFVDLPPTEPNTLSNPILASVQNIDQRYWKVENGAVVPMSNRERYLIDSAGKSDLRKLVVAIWSDYVQKIPVVIERGLTKYAAGTIKLYSEDSTVSLDFNLVLGSYQKNFIDGSYVTLTVSKKGEFNIKKDRHSFTVKAVIDYKAI